jgi:hypothetical protein
MPAKADNGAAKMPAPDARTVEVENVNHPGKVTSVAADKYRAMRAAVMRALPSAAPGLTPDELRVKVRPHLPDALFPGGATAGWWMKTVQLDLEAKGVIARGRSKPLRLRKA